MPPSDQAARPPGILRQESYDNSPYHESASPSSLLGISQSPRATPKSVSIAPFTEVISPLLLGNQKQNVDELDLEHSRGSKRNSLVKKLSSKRLSGRPPSTASPSLRSIGTTGADSGDLDEYEFPTGRLRHRSSAGQIEVLIDQVSQWIKEERAKQARRTSKDVRADSQAEVPASDGAGDSRESLPGDASTSNFFDLDKLESIVKQNLALARRPKHSRNESPAESRKGSVSRLLKRKPSSASESDYFGDEILVPSCDAVLDNSKTLSYTGGASEDSDSDSDALQRTASYRDRSEWDKFKFEILRLTHTLRLKRWRRVPLDYSHGIQVQRLSGALTNAVYVVSPPANLPTEKRHASGEVSTHHKPPPKLLLRVYGPQVEHLIDREVELAILRRLARKRIGPRLLGTFANGRFEEYFYAKPLTPMDLRDPETSRQIAKRMRELHDGIELLDSERDDGAFVWSNWTKWLDRVEKVVCWLDKQIMQLPEGAKPSGPEAWKRRGFICGVPWKQFRRMVEKYRDWLYQQCGGLESVKEQLVFAHNDTQYGNILRLMPSGESPLLLPQNTHKQLIVIDFEYANANVPGLEFANHFTEWCYNYHDERKPYAFHPNRYPTPEEQDRFIRAYVRHRPEYNVSTPRVTPTTPTMNASDAPDQPSRRPTSSISNFMLDARTPSGMTSNYAHDEAARKAAEDQEVMRFLNETRLWRLANTAQWVAWGIVQAKVPGMPDFSTDEHTDASQTDVKAREDLGERAEHYKEVVAQQHQEAGEAPQGPEEVVEDEFDYLGYAQHRALFFWADAIRLGLVKEEELPEELRGKLKSVPY